MTLADQAAPERVLAGIVYKDNIDFTAGIAAVKCWSGGSKDSNIYVFIYDFMHHLIFEFDYHF